MADSGEISRDLGRVPGQRMLIKAKSVVSWLRTPVPDALLWWGSTTLMALIVAGVNAQWVQSGLLALLVAACFAAATAVLVILLVRAAALELKHRWATKANAWVEKATQPFWNLSAAAHVRLFAKRAVGTSEKCHRFCESLAQQAGKTGRSVRKTAAKAVRAGDKAVRQIDRADSAVARSADPHAAEKLAVYADQTATHLKQAGGSLEMVVNDGQAHALVAGTFAEVSEARRRALRLSGTTGMIARAVNKVPRHPAPLKPRQIGPLSVLVALAPVTGVFHVWSSVGEGSLKIRAMQWALLLLLTCAFLAYMLACRVVERTPEKLFRPPASPQLTDPVGLCFSGGGVRSASFSLGNLQALQRNRGRDLTGIDYLAAVSGGGYLAGGWSFANGAQQSDPDAPLPFSPQSPEERWLRNNSNYIVPSGAKALGGVVRLLGGVLVNVTIIWLLIFALVRPFGWVSHELHERSDSATQLAVGSPVLTGPDIAPRWTATLEQIPAPSTDEDRIRYAVHVRPAEQSGDWMLQDRPPRAGQAADFTCAPSLPSEDGDLLRYLVDGAGPNTVVVPFDDDAAELPGLIWATGIVEIVDGKRTVLRNPSDVPVVSLECKAGEKDRKGEEAVTGSVAFQLIFEEPVGDTGDWRTSASALARDLTVKPQHRLDQGFASRSVEFDSWMKWVPGSFAAIGVLAGLVTMLGRFIGPTRWALRFVLRVSAAAAAVVFAVAVAIPWFVLKFPQLLGGGIDSASSWTDAQTVLPSAGVVALLGSAFRAYVSMTRSSGGTGSVSKLRSLWGKLSERKKELGWYELTPMKILMAIVLALAFGAVTIQQLRYATANGADGNLLGTAWMPDWLWLPEWLRWLFALLALLILHLGAEASSWSLHPYYKEQLSHAYLTTRKRQNGKLTAEPVDYAASTDFPESGPELVLCGALNISEAGVVPPARKAASFTFSRSAIGSPVTGYLDRDEIEALRSTHKRRAMDLSLLSAMSISGAAFSPGMGKKNMGTVGSLLALANLRLGVWLPNPRIVKEKLAQGKGALNRTYRSGHRRPGWFSWFYEVRNFYRLDRRYVYVSDGGHWDNLGFVELLRRNCTRIICVSASGDGPGKFTTMSEAIALAREELGVSVHLDPSPLAQTVNDDGSRDLAENSYAMGHWNHRDGSFGGDIVFIQATMTADVSFDIAGFEESQADFPHDTTADQIFNHQQFEAYRQLGSHQMDTFLNSSDFATLRLPDSPVRLNKSLEL